jgi:hypothetical protein
VNTYDSPEVTKRYIPKLEEALDALGRMMFLLYLKPGEYDDAWGPEIRQQIEDETLSNFKSFGDLVLTLLQNTGQTPDSLSGLNNA